MFCLHTMIRLGVNWKEYRTIALIILIYFLSPSFNHNCYIILFVGVQIKISAKIYEFQNEMKSLDTQEIIESRDTLNTNMFMLVRATTGLLAYSFQFITKSTIVRGRTFLETD